MGNWQRPAATNTRSVGWALAFATTALLATVSTPAVAGRLELLERLTAWTTRSLRPPPTPAPTQPFVPHPDSAAGWNPAFTIVKGILTATRERNRDELDRPLDGMGNSQDGLPGEVNICEVRDQSLGDWVASQVGPVDLVLAIQSQLGAITPSSWEDYATRELASVRLTSAGTGLELRDTAYGAPEPLLRAVVRGDAEWIVMAFLKGSLAADVLTAARSASSDSDAALHICTNMQWPLMAWWATDATTHDPAAARNRY
jgi:hypothetical protein